MNQPSDRQLRQQAVIGQDGQARLAAARVVVVGLGGLGCPAARYLAAAGIGSLVLCDHDRVDPSNLARQILFRSADVGRPKVECAARALADLSPGCNLECQRRRIDADSLRALLDDTTVVVDGSDNYATRLAVNQACLAARRPWVMGAAVRAEGQLLTLRADREGEPCYRCVYGDAATSLDDCHGAGVLTPLTGIIGTAMASEATALILDQVPRSRYRLFHAPDHEWRAIAIQPRGDCPACRT